MPKADEGRSRAVTADRDGHPCKKQILEPPRFELQLASGGVREPV